MNPVKDKIEIDRKEWTPDGDKIGIYVWFEMNRTFRRLETIVRTHRQPIKERIRYRGIK